MKKEMSERIKRQLELRNKKLYCKHDSNKVCDKCMKNISGDISGIWGDISYISGDISEIIDILEQEG